MDIDRSKGINDSYGHIILDNVIKFIASLMCQFAFPHHHVARYGGEELAIIMPDTTLEEAREICENIRAAMEKSHLRRKANNEVIGIVTISIGIARLQCGENVENFIIRADKALYQAKENGRNRVVC